MRIALLHTANVHVATFDKLFARMQRNVVPTHRVEPALLSRAQKDGLGAVRDETRAVLAELAEADAVICTCSTLGPLADEMADVHPHIVRVDRPLMMQACQDGEDILVAMCLDSTKDSTLNLLHECAKAQDRTIRPRVVMCAKAWAYFQSGDTDRYHAAIAKTLRDELSRSPKVDSIILAQASMAGAADLLRDCAVPVRSSPAMAAAYAIRLMATLSKRESHG